ncbi:hypothetical protein PENTCL1PPCAC_25791, partial [Pristionchus entomophagus]
KMDEKMKKGIPVHDSDVRRIAIGINRLTAASAKFKASSTWVTRWNDPPPSDCVPQDHERRNSEGYERSREGDQTDRGAAQEVHRCCSRQSRNRRSQLRSNGSSEGEPLHPLNDAVLVLEIDYPMDTRDNLLRTISQVYWAFGAPRFTEYRKYGWYRGGFLDTHPSKFVTPPQYLFGIGSEGDCP